MYSMTYPELGSIGAMAVEEGGKMCIKYVKKWPQGESLKENNGGTRGISGKQN